MKNIWTWILGTIIALVVIAGLAGLAFVWHGRMSARIVEKVAPHSQMWNGPSAPDGAPHRMGPPRMGPRVGMQRFRHHHAGPFMLGWMFFGMLGQLAPLAVLGLLLYGAYQLGKRHVVPVPVAVATALAPPPTTIQTHPCPKCENPVQDNWKHCPNCGETQ